MSVDVLHVEKLYASRELWIQSFRGRVSGRPDADKHLDEEADW